MAGTPSRTLVLTLTAVTDKFKKGIGAAEGDLSSFGDKLGSFAKKGAIALAALGAAAGALAIKIGKDAIKAASDLSEEINKSGELFGESASQIEAWSKTAATAFGQSRRQATQAAGTFAIFGRAAGLTGEELVDFSTGFTELASDLASFNNTSPEDAINAIGSALRGEALPLRRYGILLDDATLRQKAFELGIISSTKEALTPQQKILAAQKLIYEQAGAAAGDFARTSDGLANSQRILAANLEDVKASLGEALLPVAERFSGFLVEILPRVIDFAKELGENLAPKVEKVADFFFDKMLPALTDIVPLIRGLYESVRDNVIAFRDFVADEILPRFITLFEDIAPLLRDAWREMKETKAAIDGLAAAFRSANPEGSKFLDLIFSLSGLGWDYLLTQLNTLQNLIQGILGALERIVRLGGIGGAFGAGGDFEVPDSPTFRPGGVANSTLRRADAIVQNNINIYGATDAEAAAREVRRVLNTSQIRTGFQPVGAL